jgi:hypothetical protein
MGKNAKPNPADAERSAADAETSARATAGDAEPTERAAADEQPASPDAGDGTVWLQTGTGTFHVEVGSETYNRLMAEGATEVPPPAELSEGGAHVTAETVHGKPPSE